MVKCVEVFNPTPRGFQILGSATSYSIRKQLHSSLPKDVKRFSLVYNVNKSNIITMNSNKESTSFSVFSKAQEISFLWYAFRSASNIILFLCVT